MDIDKYTQILNEAQYQRYLKLYFELENKRKELLIEESKYEIEIKNEDGEIIDIRYSDYCYYEIQPKILEVTDELKELNNHITQYELEQTKKNSEIEEKKNLISSNIKEFRDMLYSEFSKEHFNIQNIESYTPALLQTMYTSLGLPLKDNIIFKIGDKHKIDLRLSFCISLRSGNGKGFFKDYFIEVCRELRLKGGVVTSLHEEQLIGAGVEVKTKKTKGKPDEEILIKHKGYFANDLIIKDDAIEILSNPKFDIIRNYLLNGLDIYSKNQVSKKKVGQLYPLIYYAKAVLIVFIQDVSIPEKNVATGLFRKLPVLYIKIPERTKTDYLQSLKCTSLVTSNFFINLLKEMRNQEQLYFKREIFDPEEDEDDWKVIQYSPIELTNDTEIYISEFIENLKTQIPNLSSKGKKFIETYDLVILNKILVFSVLLKLAHITYLKEKPTKLVIDLETCKIACTDYLKVLDSIFNYYDTYLIEEKEIFTKDESLVISILKKFNANENPVSLNIVLNEFKLQKGIKSHAKFYGILNSLENKGVISRDKKKAEKGDAAAFLKLIKE